MYIYIYIYIYIYVYMYIYVYIYIVLRGTFDQVLSSSRLAFGFGSEVRVATMYVYICIYIYTERDIEMDNLPIYSLTWYSRGPFVHAPRVPLRASRAPCRAPSSEHPIKKRKTQWVVKRALQLLINRHRGLPVGLTRDAPSASTHLRTKKKWGGGVIKFNYSRKIRGWPVVMRIVKLVDRT